MSTPLVTFKAPAISILVQVFILNGAGVEDAFVSKLDSAGNFVWAAGVGGTGSDVSRGIAVDAIGNVYTSGYFIGAGDFDPGAGSFILTSAGAEDVFVTKLNSAGNFVWAAGMGGTVSDYSNAIALDASGSVYTTGGFNGTADFDPGIGVNNLSEAGQGDGFISKLLQFGITISESSGSTDVTEGAAADTYTVVLDTPPSANVVVTLSPGISNSR